MVTQEKIKERAEALKPVVETYIIMQMLKSFNHDEIAEYYEFIFNTIMESIGVKKGEEK